MASSRLKLQDETYFYGWDLLQKSIEKDVIKKADVLLSLVHFILVKHYKFMCLGVGEDKTYNEDEVGSELLPEFWNDGDFRYRLRYIHNKQLFLLIAHIVGDDKILFNLLNVDTKQVSNILLDPEELVKATKGKIYVMIPDASAVCDRMRTELVDTVVTTRNHNAVSTQTEENREENREESRQDNIYRRQPLLIDGPIDPTGSMGYYIINCRHHRQPNFGQAYPEVGRGDLDPFGIGGGNLFPFPARPDILGGARPRFDPFGPPRGNVAPNPNPDHFRPPNFGNDNYYM